MKKTKKLKNLQLSATTVRDLTKATGGQPIALLETDVRTCSCGTPCHLTGACR